MIAYIYALYDHDGQIWWHMKDCHIFSSNDMVNWQDHGVALHTDDVSWATEFYAPDCIYRNGKYYLYFPDGIRTIGVAVFDTPYRPFKDVLGKPLVDKSTPGAEDVAWIFDPSVFIDEGQAYIIMTLRFKRSNLLTVALPKLNTWMLLVKTRRNSSINKAV